MPPAEPRSPDSPPPRLSDRTLPPYRYIPGINAHPVRDLAGHSYGREHVPLKFLPPGAWRQNPEYLFGIDLYNAAFWWESHEAWEEVWHTTDKDAPHGQFLQGLIQVSAAFIKWHLKQREGLVKLFGLGQSRLEFTAKTHPRFMGIDLVQHLSALNQHFAPVLAEIEPPSDMKVRESAANEKASKASARGRLQRAMPLEGATRAPIIDWPDALKDYPFLITNTP